MKTETCQDCGTNISTGTPWGVIERDEKPICGECLYNRDYAEGRAA